MENQFENKFFVDERTGRVATLQKWAKRSVLFVGFKLKWRYIHLSIFGITQIIFFCWSVFKLINFTSFLMVGYCRFPMNLCIFVESRLQARPRKKKFIRFGDRSTRPRQPTAIFVSTENTHHSVDRRQRQSTHVRPLRTTGYPKFRENFNQSYSASISAPFRTKQEKNVLIPFDC